MIDLMNSSLATLAVLAGISLTVYAVVLWKESRWTR